MHKFSILVALSMVVLLSACGDDNTNTSADAQGCASMNNLVKLATSFGDNQNPTMEEQIAALKSMDSACDQFLNNYSGTSCTLTSPDGSETKVVDASEFKSSCDEVKETLAMLSQSTPVDPDPTPTPTPIPTPADTTPATVSVPPVVTSGAVDDGTLLSALDEDQLSLSILDIGAIRNSVDGLGFINGKPVTEASYEKEYIAGATMCNFGFAFDGIKTVQTGDRYSSDDKFEQSSEDGSTQSLVLSFSNVTDSVTFSIDCSKAAAKPFTVKEIRDALQGVVKIDVKQAL